MRNASSSWQTNQGWQCEECGAWNGKNATFCQGCGAHWEQTGWVGGVPDNRKWKWKKSDGGAQSPRPKRPPSKGRDHPPKDKPPKPKKDKDKEKKKKEESSDFPKPSPFSHAIETPKVADTPPFVNTGPTPWSSSPSGSAVNTAVAANQELVQALKAAYASNPEDMPSHVKELVSKTEEEGEKMLTKRLHKAAADFGKARKQLGEISEARKTHRLRWLRHMKESITVWEGQLEEYRKVQANLQAQAARSNTEIATARKTIAQLNATGKITDLPALEELDEREAENVVDAEEQELRQKVSQLLASCAAAAGAEPIIEDISDEDLAAPSKDGKEPNKRQCVGEGAPKSA
eukprot:Skav210610  [mRNA]  locus=scaffold234:180071:181111:- [translate_table: standard]